MLQRLRRGEGLGASTVSKAKPFPRAVLGENGEAVEGEESRERFARFCLLLYPRSGGKIDL